MKNSIDNLIKFLKENIEDNFHSNYTICLNENDITISSRFSNIKESYSIDNNTGMLNFISETIKSIIREFPIEMVMSRIEVHNFMGYDSSIDKGPIQLLFEIKNGKKFFVSFSSTYPKNRDWLMGFMRYIEFNEESEYTDEFKKLDQLLEAVDFGDFNFEDENQEIKGRHI